MKILMISTDRSIFSAGSEASARMRLFGTLVDEIRIVVFSLGKQNLKMTQLADNVWAYPTNSTFRLGYLTRAYWLGSKFLRLAGPWVITCQDPFATGLVGWALSRFYRIALNVQEHGDFFSEPYWRRESIFNLISYPIGEFIIKRADSVRAVSLKIKNNLVNKFGLAPEKIVTVPVFVGVTPKVCPAEIKKDSSAYTFLTMARLVKQKNLPLLLRAFSAVVQKYPSVKLVIVGDGPEKGILVDLASELGLKEKIVFHGWTSDPGSFYCSADAYVLSSDYEGWGRVIIEAAIYRLPIIMTKVGCADEFLKDQYNGLVVPLRQEEALAQAMMAFCHFPEEARAYGLLAEKELANLPDQERTLAYYKQSWDIALAKKN